MVGRFSLPTLAAILAIVCHSIANSSQSCLAVGSDVSLARCSATSAFARYISIRFGWALWCLSPELNNHEVGRSTSGAAGPQSGGGPDHQLAISDWKPSQLAACRT